MIFRTHIVVLRATSDKFVETLVDLPESERTWHNAVAYSFGINAHDPLEAVDMAVEAAQNAVGRDGDYIGGVVIEADCRCAYTNEFAGFERHFHRPIAERGIFYVTGVTHTGISKECSIEASAELEEVKKRIAHSGLPVPSFVHPEPPEEPATKIRLLCSACNHWIEVDNTGLIYSFMDGLDILSQTELESRKSLDAAGPFMRKHLSKCLSTRGNQFSSILGIHEDDPRWTRLDEASRENEYGDLC